MAGFDCTFEELDAIGEALRVEVRQFPFRFPVHGELVADRIGVFRRAHDSLAAKGLIEGERFSPLVEELIPVFSRGRVAIAVVGSSRGAGLCARAATDGRIGVVALETGGGMRFSRVRPGVLARAVARLLPVMRPGPGGVVTVSPSPSSGWYLQPVSSGSPMSAAERIMRRPRSGSGYVTVTVRGKSPVTLSWLDTNVGRYAALPSTDRDGRSAVTYLPAGAGVLERKLTRLVGELT